MVALSSLEDWYVTNIRLTCFADLSDAELLVRILNDAFGGDFEKETKYPRQNRVDLEYITDDKLYQVEIMSNRFNLFCHAQADPEAQPTSFPHLGTIEDVERWFLDLSASVLSSKDLPTIQRLAFGPMFQQPAESRDDAYKQLSKYLRFELDAENSSDFLYRINRPKNDEYKGKDLKINRVATWSCPFYGVQKFSGTVAQSGRLDFYSLGMDLDINTDATVEGDFDEEILDTLKKHAHDFCLHGDK